MEKTFYRIVDNENNFVSKYSFQRMSEDRGKKAKWYYFSETSNMIGAIFYPDINGSIKELFDYLVRMNKKHGLNKSFQIVQVDRNVIYNGKIVSEVL